MVADRHVNAEDIGAARVRSKVAPRRALVIFSNMMDPFYNCFLQQKIRMKIVRYLHSAVIVTSRGGIFSEGGKPRRSEQTKTETLLSSVSLALVLGGTCTTKSGRGEDEAQAASASSIAADLPTHDGTHKIHR